MFTVYKNIVNKNDFFIVLNSTWRFGSHIRPNGMFPRDSQYPLSQILHKTLNNKLFKIIENCRSKTCSTYFFRNLSWRFVFGVRPITPGLTAISKDCE